jgi:hypothetical protein
MKFKSIRLTRGKVLIRRDKWERKFKSDVLDLEIPQEYQQQTWRGEVIAVGPPPYMAREESRGNDSRGIPRFDVHYTWLDGKPLAEPQDIRKGDFLTFPRPCMGSAEILIGDEDKAELTRDTADEIWMIAPVDQVLYGERPESPSQQG